ncbi:hypothetical protein ACR77J_09285 [Tissierella praeacuta]|uniref:hypothetical protein n=1 Tax=Tissierella praeacuta TaxID=43131 RepID=UPI003DA58086
MENYTLKAGINNIAKQVNIVASEITGDVTIEYTSEADLNLPAGLKITGNLTVNAPKATVNNNATVTGTITIKDVKAGTWNELVSANKLVFEAAGKTLKINDTVAALTINANATVITPKTVNAVVKKDVTVIVKADATVSDDKAVKIVGTESEEPVKLDPKETPEVNKTALTEAIAAVKYVKVSTDGSDVEKTEKWTTQEAKTALENAVKVAQAVVDKAEATQEEVNNAKTSLVEAVSIYTAAQKDGTKPEEPEETVEQLLNLAKEYKYDDVYVYTGKSEVKENTLTYTAPATAFQKQGEDANTRATMDLARLLGALYKIDKGIEEIEYDGKTYTWNTGSELKGSKWENEGVTLVSKIVSYIEKEATNLTGEGVSFDLTVKGEKITFVVKTEN